METHNALRVEIIIEAPMQRRLEEAMTRVGVTGYSILPVLGGNGRSGPWSREGQVGRAGGLIAVICIVAPERKEVLLDAAFAVLKRQIGVVSVSPCEVLRAERF
jgi:hypothetical protein